MSDPQGNEVAETVERPDDDDHDLLTFGEAGARLQTEIRAMRVRIAELSASGDQAALESARARLAALEQAAKRNAVGAINDENFERFFGYPGKARRNTT